MTAWSQESPANPPSIDPELLNLPLSHTPKEYTIAGITVTGAYYLDSTILLSISGLVIGEKAVIPGTMCLVKQFKVYGDKNYFADVRINYIKLQGDRIWIEINVKEMPRLANFKFIGPTETEAEELRSRLQLLKQAAITNNVLIQIREVVTKYYRDKGYTMSGTPQSREDVSIPNSHSLVIYVDKGGKVRGGRNSSVRK